MNLRFLAVPFLFGAILSAQSTPTTPAPAEQAAPQSTQALPDAPGTPPAPAVPTGPTAVIDTSMGRLTCKLYQQQAPLAVANFVALAEGTKDWTNPKTTKKEHGRPFYTGTTFHRVIPGFMIQGGDPLGDGTGDPGYYVKDEIDPSLTFDTAGRLAMANSGPNTNGSQFFITEDVQPALDGKYTIFGQCDAHTVTLVKAIARVDRNSNDKPLVPVGIDKVTIVREGQAVPADPYKPAAPAAAAPTAPAASN